MTAALRLERSSVVDGVTDTDLVARALDGASWAFGALYRRHVATVGNVVARLLASRQDVNDIVHDVFLVAFEKLDGLREPAAFRAWLLQIAVTRTRQLLRRRKLRRTFSLDTTVEDATLELMAQRDVDGPTRLELRGVDEALRKVSVDERVAWMLRHVEGYELREVADACGCSLSTVKRWIDEAQRVVERNTTKAGWSR